MAEHGPQYAFALGEERLPGYQRLYPFCHIPLDTIVIERLHHLHNIPPPSRTWSRLKDYKDYMEYQRKVRDRFPGESPLAAEFHLWMMTAIDPE